MKRLKKHRNQLADQRSAGSFAVMKNQNRPFATVPIHLSASELGFRVNNFSTGLQTALGRLPKTEVESADLALFAPRTVSVNVRSSAIKIGSFTFPESAEFLQDADSKSCRDDKKSQGTQQVAAASKLAERSTRIKPPNDVVKLQDRLYYLLQPPLESLLATNSLQFQFQPFPYQYEGVAFLFSRYSAILADEMGLGKTIQAITAIRILLRSGEMRRVLMICPKPLVTNWQREFKIWAPEIPVAVIEGDQSKRRWQWENPIAPVKIANYELLMRDRCCVVDKQIDFDLVVLDEAQRIKNRNSTTSQVVRAVSRKRSWALTGTPIENSPDDLVGIFEFLSPGYLNSDMQPRKMAGAIRDYVLRRTKDQVLSDMPPKLFRDAEVTLTPEQWSSYETAENEGVINLADLGAELTIQHVFELVLRLKQICNFDPATGASAKMERLEADLEEVVASGKKAIVFSQWVRTLEKIHERLQRFGPLQYHGKVPSKHRDRVIERFKEDPRHSVILMSYGAGSVGLNLQFCEYVFLFDRWWNPAVEDQAINRAHRIGVAGPVTVSRMLVRDTIEERINQVLEEKREMFASIFSENAPPRSSGMSQEEIFGLFDLQIQKSSQTNAA